MNIIRRAYLFARDYCHEFGTVWSIARTNDCERNGGHRWFNENSGIFILNGCYSLRCARCGCTQFTQTTSGTLNPTNYTFTPGPTKPKR